MNKCTGEVDIIQRFPEKRAALDDYLSTLPLSDDVEKNRGFLIQCLHKAQGIFGYLPEELQVFIANKLGLHVSAVYGVISFYSFFTTKPLGQYKICVCLGTACFVKGSTLILEEFKRQLGINEGEVTQDMKFFLGGLRCVGACSLAPVVMVNDRVYGNVTPKMVAGIIKDCK